MIALVLLLSPLHLPLLHPPLVDVEGGEGQHDEAEDEGDQDNQHQRGGEGLEELLSHLRNAGAAAACALATAGARVAAATGVGGRKGPVEETRRQRQPQLLGRPGTHGRWAGRGPAYQTSSLGLTVPTGQPREDGAHANRNGSPGWEWMRRSRGLRESLRASETSGERARAPRKGSPDPPGTSVQAPFFSFAKAPGWGCKLAGGREPRRAAAVAAAEGTE